MFELRWRASVHYYNQETIYDIINRNSDFRYSYNIFNMSNKINQF